MEKNPLIELERYGQSIWLDFLSRNLLESGNLKRLIDNDHLKGLTSNPSIFEKAIAKTNDYDQAIREHKNTSPERIYEQLALLDVEAACDLLRPVYDKNNGNDGFASIEVSPLLAYDARGSHEEGKRLWQAVNRLNLMVKIPGTKEGMTAIRTLTALGINVNVTLLFSVASYENAAMAYLAGLKERVEKSLPISSVRSVASFFVSRIDSKVDAKLQHYISTANDFAMKKKAESMIGTVAIANAKLAYERFFAILKTDLAQSLAQKGAKEQRLLWASTSTKNPRFRDVLYVESLIGAKTVNTLPEDTLDAFRDHGVVTNSLETDMAKAHETMKALPSFGIDFGAVCNELEKEGVELFKTALVNLLKAIEVKSSQKNSQ